LAVWMVNAPRTNDEAFWQATHSAQATPLAR
jgi:hypothetical protein